MLTPIQDERFQRKRRLHGRGGEDALICGARNRAGTICRNTPIKESPQGRCINHAGPKAARAHRENQRKAFLNGKISAEDWKRAEARRAANRLQWEWRRDPWMPGGTIDLAEHEEAFRGAVREHGWDAHDIPPAVTDWLRWRFRRTQIDRRDDAAWHRAVDVDARKRIAQAGPRPEPGQEQVLVASTGAYWSATSSAGRHPKRARPDGIRAPKRIRGKGYARPGRPKKPLQDKDEMNELLLVYQQNRELVAPMMANCPNESVRIALLNALRGYIARPSERAMQERWLGYVSKYRQR